MGQVLRWMTVGVLCWAMGALAGEASPGPRPRPSHEALEEVLVLFNAGKYAAAVARAEQELALREAAPEEADVATCLAVLGYIHMQKGDFARAEPLLLRGLELEEASLGKNHPSVASSLGGLATLYRRQRLYARAEPLYLRALSIQEEVLGKDHPSVALVLGGLATVYEDQGQYERAEPLRERVLAIREAAPGKDDPQLADALNELATLCVRRGLYARAEPLYQRALAIREAALGKNHPAVAQLLSNLATLSLYQGSYEQAGRLYQRALAIGEAALGGGHPDIAQMLNNLSAVYMLQGSYAQAEPLLERALAIEQAVVGEDQPSFASALTNLARLYTAQGLYARAEPLLERALAINEAALGKNHPTVALVVNNLADLYTDRGLYARAEPLYQRGLAINEAALGKNHPAVSSSLSNLASLYKVQGLIDRAESFLKRALAIREAAHGKNHLTVASSLGELASLYLYKGEFARAEPLLERALAIEEAALGKDHPTVANLLGLFATLYREQGLYSRAEPLYARALVLEEASLGKNHPTVASLLNDFATLYEAQGFYDRARSLLERSLAIKEATLGENHPNFSPTLQNLANLYLYEGAYARAEPLSQRALAIAETTYGKNHPLVTQPLLTLATLYRLQGSYGRARPLYERALAIREAAYGKNHPTVALPLNESAALYIDEGLFARAEPLLERARALQAAASDKHPPQDVVAMITNLAITRYSQGRLAEALPLFTRAFVLSEQRLRQEALDFSESRLNTFLQYLRADEELLYALLRSHPEDANVRRLALSGALLLKGRSVELIADTSRAIYRGLSERDRDTFEQLRGLRTQLATLSFQGPGSLAPAEYTQRLQALTELGDALEADLAKRSAPLRVLTAPPPPAEVVERVAAALPKDAALVEFVVSTDPHFPPAPQRSGSPRYLALVLLPDARIRAVDLGPAEPIDRAASQLRNALANREASFQASAEALYRLAFRPLLPLLGDTRRLFLSPDGQLGLVPFAALHDGQGFLVDTFDFTYLTSGRDLLPRSEGGAPTRSVVVFAAPDFNAPPPARPAPAASEPTWTRSRSAAESLGSPLRAKLAEGFLVPLPGTREEALALQRMLPQAQLFLGADASKERLLHLPAPGILHLATHGFFLEDAPVPEGSRGVGHFGAMGDKAFVSHLPDPLLRSGLVFAGARSPSEESGVDNGLVTALELAGLDLWGTQLVVLSACDTGRGDVKLGQGVYGLRRALVAAGAETVVMSLWKVNDEKTRILMESYYRNLLAGQGRSSALREAMRAFRQLQPHPHYWAPFIVLGQDTPLRAIHPDS